MQPDLHTRSTVASALALAAAFGGTGCGLPGAIGRADTLVAAGKYDEADAAYVSATERAPLEAWRGACRARMLAGKLGPALEACDKSLAAGAAGANDPASLTVKGRVLRAMGKHAEAVVALETARAASPDDREVIAWLGMAYADALERGKAIATVRTWADLRPDNPVRWAELASIQAYVYDLEDSERSWRKVIDLDPAGSAAAGYAGLAESFLMRGRATDARRAAESALDHDPAQPYAGTILARALALAGERDLAKARLELSAPAGKRAMAALLARAEVGRVLSDAGSAKAALDAALGLDATDERAFYLLGWLHEVMGDTVAAVAAYRHACDIRPFYLEARWRLAQALAGDPPRAKEALLDFLRLARDVTALRGWVDEALAKLPADALAPVPSPASSPALSPAPEPSPG